MKLRYLKNVVTLSFCSQTCTNCGICLDVCPQGVFDQKDGNLFVADRDACMECGVCERNCPFGAVTVRAGVGCAQAILQGAIRGKEPNCGSSDRGCY